MSNSAAVYTIYVVTDIIDIDHLEMKTSWPASQKMTTGNERAIDNTLSSYIGHIAMSDALTMIIDTMITSMCLQLRCHMIMACTWMQATSITLNAKSRKLGVLGSPFPYVSLRMFPERQNVSLIAA